MNKPDAPQRRDFVRVRPRRWLVEDERDVGDGLTALRLACVDDDAQGETVELLWDAELDGSILSDEGWAAVAKIGTDDPTVFSADDRVAPRDVVPTDEEGIQLLGAMVAYAGTFSLGENVVVHHIDTSWNQAWTGTNQIRHFVLEGDTLTITTAPYKSYLDGAMGRS